VEATESDIEIATRLMRELLARSTIFRRKPGACWN